VENGIVHGTDRSLSGGTIRVEAVSVGGADIEIRIWNNGRLLSADTREKLQSMLDAYTVKAGRNLAQPTSIGLLNVQARIRMIYGEQYGITIQSGDDLGTTFAITIRKTFSDGGEGHETDRIG
jgi:two-component system sensor histidine kinase YesM